MSSNQLRPGWMLFVSSVLNALVCLVFASFILAALSLSDGEGWPCAVFAGLVTGLPVVVFAVDEYRAIVHRNVLNARRMQLLLLLFTVPSVYVLCFTLGTAIYEHHIRRWLVMPTTGVAALVVAYLYCSSQLHAAWTGRLRAAGLTPDNPQPTVMRFSMRELFLVLTAIGLLLGLIMAFRPVAAAVFTGA